MVTLGERCKTMLGCCGGYIYCFGMLIISYRKIGGSFLQNLSTFNNVLDLVIIRFLKRTRTPITQPLILCGLYIMVIRRSVFLCPCRPWCR